VRLELRHGTRAIANPQAHTNLSYAVGDSAGANLVTPQQLPEKTSLIGMIFAP